MKCVSRPHFNEQGIVIIIHEDQPTKVLLSFSQNITVLLSRQNVINISGFSCDVCGICNYLNS